MSAVAGRCGLIAPASEFARALFMDGRAWWQLEEPDIVTPEPWVEIFRLTHTTSVIYVVRCVAPHDHLDEPHARAVFSACQAAGIRHLTVIVPGEGASSHAAAWQALQWAAMSAVGYRRVSVATAADRLTTCRD